MLDTGYFHRFCLDEHQIFRFGTLKNGFTSSCNLLEFYEARPGHLLSSSGIHKQACDWPTNIFKIDADDTFHPIEYK